MSKSATLRLLLLFTLVVTLAFPALADNVTVSGTVSFSSLDGGPLDHDHVHNGIFTVSDGDLTILGTITCNDDAAGASSACPMQFVVSGNVTMAPGSAIFAENRTKPGNGGDISFTVGGNMLLQGSTPSQAGALISSAKTNDGNPAHGGDITINSGGTFTQQAGSIISSGARDANAGAISIISGGAQTIGGRILAGPQRTLTSTIYTAEVITAGGSHAVGGAIALKSNTHTEPGLVIASTAVIASQGADGGGKPVTLEGCNVQIDGLVASLANRNAGPAVLVRSGSSITIDGSTLPASGSAHLGRVRADALHQSATGYRVDLHAADAINVTGASSAGSLFAISSNGGQSGNNDSGSIGLISTGGTVAASGNAFQAAGHNSNDRGGVIDVAAKGNVSLNGASLDASGGGNGAQRAGGHVKVRSYSGAVSWQSGVGDVRPIGSSAGVPVAQQGTIALTYCTSVSTSGSTFPANGSPVGVFPTTAQSCSPAAPSLPAGEAALPDCNDPPIANNDTYAVLEGGTLSVPAPGVLANDVDPEGQPITATLVSGPAHSASFTFNADGSFTYVHDGSETTVDTFTYKANDGLASGNTATVTINITPVNDPPVANNDSYTVDEDVALNVVAPGVLANDTDPDGPTKAAILVSGPAHASSFALNPDGSFTYTGAANYNGSDSFTYQVSDGSLTSNVATVSITVTAVNDAPVAANDSYTTDEDTPLTVAAPGVLGNDSDVDSPALTAVLVSGPAHAASFSLNADGSFSYTPAPDYNGSDSFSYTANDGSLNSNVATVAITVNAVNDAPVAQPDSYSTAEDTPLTVSAPGVLANDSDVDSPTLHAVLVSGAANGAVTLNADGSFTYAPNANFNGVDTFTYKANDGSADSNTVTVSIAVTAVNDAPSISAPATAATNEDSSTSIAISVNDVDAGSGNVTVTLGVSHGTLTLASTSGLSVSGNGTASITATGTLADLNAALGGTSYAPAANYNGSDTLAITANDNGNTGSGGPLSDNRAVAITVNAVNDAPVNSVPGTQTVAEDTTLVFSAANNNAITVSDADAGNNAIQVTLAATNGTVSVGSTQNVNVSGNGTANVTIVGAISDINAALDGATFLGTQDFDGTATITVTTDDLGNSGSGGAQTDTDTISINVTAVNDAPVAHDDGPFNVTTGGSITISAPGVLGNDADVDSPSLTAVLVSNPAHGTVTLNADGSFTYTNDGTSGVDSFTYKASDGSLQSNVATVTLNVTTQPPVANTDNYVAVGNTELRVGTGPSATPAAIVSGSVLDNDIDADTPHSGLSISAYDSTSLNGGTVSMAANGTFNYLPAAGFSGIDSFHYSVTDGTNTATGTVTITINTRVWYVNNTGANGTGRSNSPFNNLLSAQNASAAGDVVYVHTGTATYSGGIALKNNQALIGNGVALVVSGYALNGAGARPVVGTGVTMASGDTVTGLNITAGAVGINASGSNGGTIDQVNVSGGTDGIDLVSASGSFTISSVALTPGGAGLVISGGTATVNASNLTVSTTTGTGIQGNAGTLNIGGTSSVTTTSGTAVDLSGMALGVTLGSVHASNDATGISLSNTTGSFTVNGGAISNMTTRGFSASNATNITLAGMTFTSAGSTNGASAATCTSLGTSTNTVCNAAIWLSNVTGVTLSNVSVNGGAQIGINGNGVTNFTMTNSEVKNVGDEPGESGMLFQNLNGTVTITSSNIHDNHAKQMYVENLSGSLTMNVTGSTFANSATPDGSHGLFISTRNSATATVTIGSSTFTNNFVNGVQIAAANTASNNVTISGSTFANELAGINLTTADAASLTYSITNNPTFTGMSLQSINIARGSPNTGTVSGTISGNTIGTSGVAGSACAPSGNCDGIDLRSLGTSGTLAATITNNNIYGVTAFGINASATSGASSLQLRIANNTIGGGGNNNAIQVQSGALSSDTTSVCADITGNTISGAWDLNVTGAAIRVRNRFAGTTFRLPGYAGTGNSTSQVAAFLSGQNGGATASASINNNTFGGGSACVTP